MSDFTELLTPEEIAFKKRIVPTSPMQRATLEAALRTGVRYGVNARKGRYNVVKTLYRIDKKGRPHGMSRVVYVKEGLDDVGVIATMNSLR
jgi:hypothetical protein